MAQDSRFPAWAWWIIGAITILAISILIFSVVLGIRAGQQQVEIQRRQQIGIALQRATDFQAEGNLQAALDEYQKILVLDSTNDLAQQGIEELLAMASDGSQVAGGGVAPVAAAPTDPAASPLGSPTPAAQTPAATSAGTPSAATTSSPAATPSSALAGYWETAQRAARAGRWQEVLNNLLIVQQTDPTYNSAQLKEQLFTAYVNLGLEEDNVDNLEEALTYYEKALALHPGAQDIERERNLIEQYLDILAYTGVDWPLVIRQLQGLYALEPDYRDVEERLQNAHLSYAEALVLEESWCIAQDEFNAALSVVSTPEIVAKRDEAQTQCQLAVGGTVSTSATITGTPSVVAVALPQSVSTAGGPTSGRILYSAADPVTGRSQILSLAVGKSTPAQPLLQDAAQPALRGDGGRMVYHNLRSDLSGLSSFDPATDLQLRFTNFAEDMLPSWNGQGSRVVFASTREGDRRWRIYVMWAEENGGTDTLTFGESPDWHPSADLIVYRGCDQSGNRCGLWTISSSGADAQQLTAVPADNRPQWSPSGNVIAFMSDGRDGNAEIYVVDATSREVTRLTDSPAIDALPTVSPDGRWVAFVSNRDGSWKIYAVPSTGGEIRLIAPVIGDVGNYFEHGMQWVN